MQACATSRKRTLTTSPKAEAYGDLAAKAAAMEALKQARGWSEGSPWPKYRCKGKVHYYDEESGDLSLEVPKEGVCDVEIEDEEDFAESYNDILKEAAAEADEGEESEEEGSEEGEREEEY